MGTPAPPARMRYCFVFGCPRSGTTALTRLLHAHPAVVMGMERYKFVANAGEPLQPALFTAERFLDFRSTDTNITPQTMRFARHYEQAAERLGTGGAAIIGDKVLAKQTIVDEIIDNFPDVHLVFIYRDLLRVASSFCARAMNPDDHNWPEWKTHENALENWDDAFAVAGHAIARIDDRVFVVRYERLFNGDVDACRALFAFLGLEPTDEVLTHFASATSRWPEHEAKELVLTADQHAFLEARTDTETLAAFDRRFAEQLAAP